MGDLIKKAGNKLNGVIKRNKYLDKLDAVIEATFNKFTTQKLIIRIEIHGDIELF